MNIIVNGNKKSFNEGTTLQEMIHTLNLEGKVMAAAVNMDVVKQDNWANRELHEGDKVELLDFVGGG